MGYAICPGAPQRVSRGKVRRAGNIANIKLFCRVLRRAPGVGFHICPGVPLAGQCILSCKSDFVVQMHFVIQMGFSPFVVQNFVVQNSHLYDKDKLSCKIQFCLILSYKIWTDFNFA